MEDFEQIDFDRLIWIISKEALIYAKDNFDKVSEDFYMRILLELKKKYENQGNSYEKNHSVKI